MRDTMMRSRAFPALGFDPAPGSPAAIDARAREADLAARALAGAVAAAVRLGDGWPGGEVRDLVRELQAAAEAHAALARILAGYAEDLRGLQRRAGELERRAATDGGTGAAVARAAAEGLRAEHRAAAGVAAVQVRAAAEAPGPVGGGSRPAVR